MFVACKLLIENKISKNQHINSKQWQVLYKEKNKNSSTFAQFTTEKLCILLWWDIGWEKGEGYMIQYLLFVLSWVKLFFINYIDVYNFFVLLFCFLPFIYYDHCLYKYVQRCFIYITLFILFHPQTWVMNLFYILMSNCTLK